MHTTFRVRGASRLATTVAAAALTALLSAITTIALPGTALAATPPELPADADARCDTSPTSYPGNGVAVPGGASCAVVTTSAGVAVAEVWSWTDDDGLHWYNYAAQGYTGVVGSALTMCASGDESAAGIAYECSTDSSSLLFTMPNLFVTWPSVVDADLFFCESVDLVGLDGLVLTAHACGTLSGVASGEASQDPPPTTPPSTDEPSPSPSPSPPPPAATTPPVDPPVDEPAPTSEPTGSAPVLPPSEPEPTASAPSAPPPSGPAATNLPVGDEPALDSEPVATPVESESVALVGGAAFPVALVVALAATLALGGVGVLAGPTAMAAWRRRT